MNHKLFFRKKSSTLLEHIKRILEMKIYQKIKSSLFNWSVQTGAFRCDTSDNANLI